MNLPLGQSLVSVIGMLCILVMICFPPSPSRKAKENLFGQNRSSSNGHVVFEKQQLELDSVVEETITGDYALVINGHSLVSLLKAFVLSFSLSQ